MKKSKTNGSTPQAVREVQTAGISVTLAGWTSGPQTQGHTTAKPEPAGVRAQNLPSAQVAADMEAVRAILNRLLKPEAVEPWLNARVPSLGQQKPLDVIRRGGVTQVMEVLARVEEGIHL